MVEHHVKGDSRFHSLKKKKNKQKKMQYFEYCCEAILLHYRGECRQIQIENIESREYFWSLCICDYQRKILLKFHRQLIPRKFVRNIAIKSKLLSRQ